MRQLTTLLHAESFVTDKRHSKNTIMEPLDSEQIWGIGMGIIFILSFIFAGISKWEFTRNPLIKGPEGGRVESISYEERMRRIESNK